MEEDGLGQTLLRSGSDGDADDGVDRESDRFVYANRPEYNPGFRSNEVITAKYSVITFLPVFLFQQFTRFANVYFLSVGILQTIPRITITNGLPTAFLPLSFVLFFDGVITATEDFFRHRDDRATNSQHTLAAREGEFQPVEWQHVRVGDVLKVRRGETIPADCILLRSESDDGPPSDTCYVMTAQLDGETNLKLRRTPTSVASSIPNEDAAASFRGAAQCEAPSASFTSFTGMLELRPELRPLEELQQEPTWPQRLLCLGLQPPSPSLRKHAVDAATDPPCPLDAESLLLRGSQLRSVDAAYVLVVYTGTETKAQVKQQTASMKRAQSEQALNHSIMCVALILLLVCAIGTTGFALWAKAHSGAWYLQRETVRVVNGVEKTGTFFLLNASLIPVSLYVSMRLARSLQRVLMERDSEMVYEDQQELRRTDGAQGRYPLQVRCMDLNDDLGQITHVFTDKTGTLTLNYMEFRKFSIAGVSFGKGTTTVGRARARRMRGRSRAVSGSSVSGSESGSLASDATSIDAGQTGLDDDLGPELVGVDTDEEEKGMAEETGISAHGEIRGPHVSFKDGSESHPRRKLRRAGLQISPNEPWWQRWGCDPQSEPPSDMFPGPSEGSPQLGDLLHELWLHMAVNHSVIPEQRKTEEDGRWAGCTLSASSPDEEAFVQATARFGYMLVDRQLDTITLEVWRPDPNAEGNGPGERGPWAHDWMTHVGRRANAVLPEEDAPVSAVCPLGELGLADLPRGFTASRVSVRILHMLPYTQERKRMSVVAALPDGRTVLFCKGADSVVMARLRQPRSPEERVRRTQTEQQMVQWGNDGLRTLVFGTRSVGKAELREWGARYERACSNYTQLRRRKQGLPNDIDACMDELEQNMLLQGATANEDKLQTGVPETIAVLARAGMRLWMLTGDKAETAVNIGFATRLVTERMRPVSATVDGVGSTAGGVRALVDLARSKGFISQAKKRERLSGKRNCWLTWCGCCQRPASDGQARWDDKVNAPADETDSTSFRMGNEADNDDLWNSQERRACCGWWVLCRRGCCQPKRWIPTWAEPIGNSDDSFSEWTDEDEEEEDGDEEEDAGGEEESERTPARSTPGKSYDQIPLVRPKDETSGRWVSEALATEPASGPSTRRRPWWKRLLPWNTGAETDDDNQFVALDEGDGAPPNRPPPMVPSVRLRRRRRPRARVAVVVDDTVLDWMLGDSPSVTGAEEEVDDQTPGDASVARSPARVFATWEDEVAARLNGNGKEDKKWRRRVLLRALSSADAVVCCRCRPDQKASLVRLVRSGSGSKACRTLAIGDGANDVNMIQTAHVGVGLAGREGRQAANASDYAIGRFRFLARLLLVHGRSNYRRLAKLAMYMLYKNSLLELTQFWFSIWTGWSGQKFYLEIFGTQLYNLTYTGLPILLVAMMDRDVSPESALRLPALYREGPVGRLLNMSVLRGWLLSAVFESLVIFFCSMGAYWWNGIWGETPYIFELGSLCYTLVIVVDALRIAVEASDHSWMLQLAISISVLLWFPCAFIADAWNDGGMKGGMHRFFGAGAVWMTVPLVAFLTMVRIILWRGWRRSEWPTLRMVAHEADRIQGDIAPLRRVLERAHQAGLLPSDARDPKAFQAPPEVLGTSDRAGIAMPSPLVGPANTDLRLRLPAARRLLEAPPSPLEETQDEEESPLPVSSGAGALARPGSVEMTTLPAPSGRTRPPGDGAGGKPPRSGADRRRRRRHRSPLRRSRSFSNVQDEAADEVGDLRSRSHRHRRSRAALSSSPERASRQRRHRSRYTGSNFSIDLSAAAYASEQYSTSGIAIRERSEGNVSDVER